MSDGETLTVEEKRLLVTEAKEIFGAQAARELWVKLGLPGSAQIDHPMAKRERQADWPKLMLRLPPDTKAWVEAQAALNATSQNSEIVRSIRERMDREPIPVAIGAGD